MGARRRWRIAVFGALVAVAASVVGGGCSSFGAAATSDAADAADVSVPEADAATTPCDDPTSVVVLGLGPSSASEANRTADPLAAHERAAYSFPIATSSTAGRACLFLPARPSSNVYLGVYSDVGGSPLELLGRASFDRPHEGWNAAQLDTPVPLPRGAYWIVVGADEGSMTLSDVNGPDAGCAHVIGTVDAGIELANPWTGTKHNPRCELLAYLGL